MATPAIVDSAVESSATCGLPGVDVRETHTGVVVLVGNRAYKAKKAVLTDFLDFRTAEQRERACAREVELNSRLAPGSYLGVAHLDDPAGGPAEPLVVMRRYRDEDSLASIVTQGRPADCVLDRVARVLARFHRDAKRGKTIDAEGEASAVLERWHANLSELRQRAPSTGLAGASVERIEFLVDRYVAGRGALFSRRIRDRRIVDGHGDLLADDIFWVDGEPALLDCLEFDDELRYVDTIDDAAFLAMDLEFQGRRDFGDYFLERFATYSADPVPSSLRDFYIAYRAVVRAKVDCVRLSQGRLEAALDAARHLAIAIEHLEDGAVRLMLVGGGPGTGKSTLARGLAQSLGAHVISTDDVRRQLRQSGSLHGEPGVLNEGLYSQDQVTAVYREALRQADTLLAAGQSVILDGTWRDQSMRETAKCVAEKTHAVLIEVLCAVPTGVAADRVRTRKAGNSDATPGIATTLASSLRDWETAVRIDTSRPIDDVLGQAQDIWFDSV